ncbi:MAG: type II toxin-antitoxin system VapC family toxin [Cytophagales bacterium]|nr:type II toxin-antitoxin system VapC family toxin [Cytophagales bacterium]
MEKEPLVLCDTNIIIEFYKGNPVIVDSLKSIGQQAIAVSIVTSGELIYGALNKKELSRIKKDLKVLDIDKQVCDQFIELMTTYSLSHNLGVPDAFIAATAIAHDIPMYTLNKRDFKYIQGLKPWK